jgi:hypothetical protein
MKWSDLTKNQRVLAIVAAVVALLLVVGGAYAIGRATSDEGDVTSDTTATPEATATAEPEVAEVAEQPAPAQPEPEAQSGTDDQTPDAGPSDEGSVRLFGQLKGIRDESGGGWAELYADVDTAAFLTGQEALDWLSSRGDAEFYNANYWYARNEEHTVGSYRILQSDQPAVWMYTWPDMPAIGFYGPGMDKQVSTFGFFYDRIYMYEDEDQLLNRYYWFTIEDDHVTIIEEQPRDPYYEP